jgi:hypothetical protein
MADLVWWTNVFIAVSVRLFSFIHVIRIFNEMVDDVFIILQLVEFFLLKIDGHRLVIALVIVEEIAWS